MDKNLLLIQLSEDGRFWHSEFEELTPAEQVFRAIWDLERDVNNGGFDQYYFNSSGDTAFAVVEALREIGAHKAARIVEQANGIFPASAPPKDRFVRQEALESIDPDRREALEQLDAEFFEYPDDLTELLFDYVRRNRADIDGTASVGIE